MALFHITRLLMHTVLVLFIVDTTKALIIEEPMPKLLKECLENAIRHSDAKKDLASNIDFMCINQYIMQTPDLRWKPSDSHDMDPKLDRDVKLCRKSLGLDKRYSRRVMYNKRSIRNHIKDARERIKRQINKRKRKEYRCLTDQERNDFHRAVNMLKNDKSFSPNMYDAIVNLHPGSRAPFAHYGPAFVGWHRVYLWYFEMKLREKVPHVTLPYWDSSLEDRMKYPASSILFSDRFAGPGKGVVNRGPFAGWKHETLGLLIRNVGTNGSPFSTKTLETLVNKLHTKEFCSPFAPPHLNLEALHGSVHAWIGGWLDNLNLSPSDPLFWMHHCFVDYLWEKIRKNQIKNGIDPFLDYPNVQGGHGADDVLKPFSSLKNKDSYRNEWTDIYYEYENTPHRCRVNEDCRSKYCRCNRGLCEPLSMNDIPNIRKRRSASKHRRRGHYVEHDMTTNNEIIAKYFPYLRYVKPESSSESEENFPVRVSEPEREPYSIPNENVVKTSQIYHAVQNTFTINGVEDINQWGYIPILVYYRSSNDVKYESHPIRNGKIMLNDDIYHMNSGNRYNMGRIGKPAQFNKCEHLGSGAFKVYVKSYGLSYDGRWTDFAVVDERQKLSTGITQVGVQNPFHNNNVTAYVTAYDSCGRECKPHCLIPGSNPPRYRRCSGTIRITSDIPRMYSGNCADANLHVYDYSTIPPTLSNEKVFLAFYCDQEETWPWDGIQYGK